MRRLVWDLGGEPSQDVLVFGALLVAAMVLGSSTAAATPTRYTVGPPFKGQVGGGPTLLNYTGCGANASIVHPLHFHLKSGNGGGMITGNASNCTTPKSTGQSSASASAAGALIFSVIISGIPKKAQRIEANLAGNLSEGFTASTGEKSKSPKCSGALDTSGYNLTYWEWGYGAYGGFASTAYVDDVETDGVWSNSSYNTKAVPSPFHLNSTSAYYHNASSETLGGDCSSIVDAYGWVFASLTDLNTGTTYTPWGSNLNWFWTATINLLAFREWGWSNSSSWWGPPGNATWGNSSSSTKVFNDNETLFSEATYDSGACSFLGSLSSFPCHTWQAGGSKGTLTVTNTTALTRNAFWWTGPFSNTDVYRVKIGFAFYMEAMNDWPHGYASFELNAATHGNGIDLKSITA